MKRVALFALSVVFLGASMADAQEIEITPSGSQSPAKRSTQLHYTAHMNQERHQQMDIKRAGSRPSTQGPAQYFTGGVRVDPLFEAPAPGHVTGGLVTFEPGARSAWHAQPLGQTLIVVSGFGWTQCWGGAKEEIRPGDVIYYPPRHKHWHGATSTTAMSHIAIQEHAGHGKVVEWLEQVTDEQYLG
jgi:quercetin dioxygenase-like cupin family protein